MNEDDIKCEYFSTNSIKRKYELREEYINILPRNKKLAIDIHKILCKKDHICSCKFYHEIEGGLIDNWDLPDHKKWLEMADRIIASEVQ